jgi:hypothetical protein
MTITFWTMFECYRATCFGPYKSHHQPPLLKTYVARTTINTVELGYNVMKGIAYFVSL